MIRDDVAIFGNALRIDHKITQSDDQSIHVLTREPLALIDGITHTLTGIEHNEYISSWHS